jgi:hypothetical protein
VPHPAAPPLPTSPSSTPQLQRHGRRQLLSGFNAHDLASAPLVDARAFTTARGASGLAEALGLLRQAAARRFNAVRVFAHGTDPDFPFQV